MPSLIRILPDNLINKIAAGEVVERPASVVKELIENSLDAGATEVLVDVEQSGTRLIRVADNGCGLSREDAESAFERHATSKISTEADLDAIRTMGFRGEALSSIAAVAQVRLTTGRRGETSGVLVEVDGGTRKPAAEAASAGGTTVEVGHLFFNTPARLKFLKSPATEFSHIIAAVSRQALARPGVRFRLTHNRKLVLDLPASGSLDERVFQIYGKELSGNLVTFSGGREPARVSGLIGKPGYDRGDKAYQEFYVNGRSVRNAALTHALYEACRDLLMRDRHPAAFVFIEIAPSLVDVNVHPAKAEVRFRSQAQVHDLVRDILRDALRESRIAAPDRSSDGVRDAVAGYLANAFQDPARSENPLAGAVLSRENGAPGSRAVAERGDESLSPALPGSASPGQLHPLAQVHDSYIVAQSNDGLALIDQHAAHERVLFEKLQDQYSAGSVPVQDLLIPVQTELGAAEGELLREHLPDLRELGFVVEEFGGGTFVIKGVPAFMTGGDYQRLLADILDEIKVHGRSFGMDRMRDDLLSVMACHPAIKVHRKLSSGEMEGLIRDLFACRMPHSCPHGRPTVIRFSMDEIRRMFRRT